MKIRELLEIQSDAETRRLASTAAAPRASAPRPRAKVDPTVQARQQELINAGAKIKADGIMGPQTQKAEKEFGAKVDALKASQQSGPTTITNPAQATQAAPAPAAATTAQPGNTDPTKGPVDYSLGSAQPGSVSTALQPAAGAPAAAPTGPTTITNPAQATQAAPAQAAAPAASDTGEVPGVTTQPGATAQAAAPAAAPNPWEGKDPAKAAAWAKLSPGDQQWIGMADPTDRNILARAPSNGGFLGSLGFGKKKEESITQVVAERNQTYKKDNELLQRMRHIAGLK